MRGDTLGEMNMRQGKQSKSSPARKNSIAIASHVLFDEPAAAEYLDLQPGTLSVWRCTKRYGVPYLKIGRLVRYRKLDLDAWLASRAVNAKAA